MLFMEGKQGAQLLESNECRTGMVEVKLHHRAQNPAIDCAGALFWGPRIESSTVLRVRGKRMQIERPRVCPGHWQPLTLQNLSVAYFNGFWVTELPFPAFKLREGAFSSDGTG